MSHELPKQFDIASRPRLEEKRDESERDACEQAWESSSDTPPLLYPRQPNISIPVPEYVDLVSSSEDELIVKPRKVKIEPRPIAKERSRSNSKKRPSSAEESPPPKRQKRQRLEVGHFLLELVNEVDRTELPANFRFIDECIFREGTSRLPVEARTGCNCKENQGRNIGCEYVQKCECLQDAEDSKGRRIGFPYHGEGKYFGCLQTKYLQTRNVIYECNDLCGCGPDCRNKVVSRGRQIPLEIFRTTNRGWGLRCPQPILRGQFIDTYRGEVITNAEADRREASNLGSTKDSFLFSLDKFEDMFGEKLECFVVDGEFMGGPARFINHSCDPNCDVFAVSNVRGDYKFYDLAMFALEDIPAGTELTFDYIGDHDDMVASQQDVEDAKAIRNGKLATRCLCGSENCRGYLWL